MRLHFCKSCLVAVLCGTYVFSAYSVTSMFSDYGQIQNVQNYSSNPFWNPNSPYNQKLPQPVYVQGASLNSEDCMKVVYYLVSAQCIVRNNCQNTSLSDIRPEIMIDLSKLPGANYVSSCSGYIDTAFESYVKQNADMAAEFPDAPIKTQVNIQNPYKQTPSKQQQEINEREKELQLLQQQNDTDDKDLSAETFPVIYDDLSFSSKMQLMTDGYEPFKDKSAYIIPEWQSKDKWCAGEGKNSEICKEPEKEEPKKEEQKKEEPKKEEPVKQTVKTEKPVTTKISAPKKPLEPQTQVHPMDSIRDYRPRIIEPIVLKQEPVQDIKLQQDVVQSQAEDVTSAPSITSNYRKMLDKHFDYAEIEILPDMSSGCYIKCKGPLPDKITDVLNTKILELKFIPGKYCVTQNVNHAYVANIINFDAHNFYTPPRRFEEIELRGILYNIENMPELKDPNCKKISLRIHKYKKTSGDEFIVLPTEDYSISFN